MTLLFSLVGCATPAEEEAVLEKVQVSGVVRSGGERVPEVAVSMGDDVVMTDAKGRFSFDVDVGRSVILATESPEWSTTSLRVEQVESDVQLEMFVVPTQVAVLEDAQAGGTVAAGDVTVTFGRGSLGAAAGPVEVVVSELYEPWEVASAPGAMLTAEGKQLESFGMVEVRLFQAGEPVALSAPVELSFKAAGGDASHGLWTFHESDGVWVQEGLVTVERGRAVARVDHFTWWNVDEPLENTSCLRGRLVLADGMPAPTGVQVRLVGQDYYGGGSTLTGANGEFCGHVKPNSANMAVAGMDGEEPMKWEVAGTAGGPASCRGVDLCADLGDVMAAAGELDPRAWWSVPPGVIEIGYLERSPGGPDLPPVRTVDFMTGGFE